MCLYLFFGAILGFLPAVLLGMLIGGNGEGVFFDRFLQSLPYSFGVWIVLSVVGAGLINLWMQRYAARALKNKEYFSQYSENTVAPSSLANDVAALHADIEKLLKTIPNTPAMRTFVDEYIRHIKKVMRYLNLQPQHENEIDDEKTPLPAAKGYRRMGQMNLNLPTDEATNILFVSVVDCLCEYFKYSQDAATELAKEYYRLFTDKAYCDSIGIPVQDDDFFFHESASEVAMRAHYYLTLKREPDPMQYIEFRFNYLREMRRMLF